MLAIPLYDDTPEIHMPLATAALVAACSLVFLWQIGLPPRTAERAIYSYGMIPAVLLGSAELPARLQIIPSWLTLITCQFLHAGLLHLLGNMLYLWVFGDELEANYLGPTRFGLFYLVCGLAAGALQIAVNPSSTVPNLGASGAIAGVLGGFQVVFPRDRILVYIFPFWHARITALMLIGFWFLTQLVSGVGSITSTTQTGVAYFAHIGGFIAGLVLVRLFGIGQGTAGEQDYLRLGR